MKQIIDKKKRAQEIEKIFQEPPLPPSARGESGECLPDMRPVVGEAFCESMPKDEKLYRALRASGD